MKLLTLFVLLFLVNSTDASERPGHDKDNGGFLVFCSGEENQEVDSGYYSLDYLYGLRNFSAFDFLAEDPSKPVGFYLDKVESVLFKIKETRPQLLKSFQVFRQRLFANQGWEDDQTYYWDDKKGKVKTVSTNFLTAMRASLPQSCMKQPLIQAVRREVVAGAHGAVESIYHYDPKIKIYLQEKPLQLSMLFVHEWLWDFVGRKDLLFLMRVNKVLHSKQVQDLPSSKIEASLVKLKLGDGACGVNPGVGSLCAGGALYAGKLGGENYMVTPSGCTDSISPQCAGGTDTLRKSWSGETRPHFDIKEITNIVADDVASSPLQRGDFTTPLIARHSPGSAASFCKDMVFAGYSDWYLPSKAELAYIYCQSSPASYHNPEYPDAAADCLVYGGKVRKLLGFADADYWSSSEASVSQARAQYFGNGGQWSSSKTKLHYVRCVRRY